MFESSRCSASQSVLTSTSFAYPFPPMLPPFVSAWRSTTERTPPEPPSGASELACSANDLPEHVEREHERSDEPHAGEPVADARHQRRGDEQADDDERGADAVRDRPQHV